MTQRLFGLISWISLIGYGLVAILLLHGQLGWAFSIFGHDGPSYRERLEAALQSGDWQTAEILLEDPPFGRPLAMNGGLVLYLLYQFAAHPQLVSGHEILQVLAMTEKVISLGASLQDPIPFDPHAPQPVGLAHMTTLLAMLLDWSSQSRQMGAPVAAQWHRRSELFFDHLYRIGALSPFTEAEMVGGSDRPAKVSLAHWSILRHAPRQMRDYFIFRQTSLMSVDAHGYPMALSAAFNADLESLSAIVEQYPAKEVKEGFAARGTDEDRPTIMHSAIRSLQLGTSAEKVIAILQFLAGHGVDPSLRSKRFSLIEELNFWIQDTENDLTVEGRIERLREMRELALYLKTHHGHLTQLYRESRQRSCKKTFTANL